MIKPMARTPVYSVHSKPNGGQNKFFQQSYWEQIEVY